MDKQQAQQIIQDTFESPFDKGRFTGFIKNLLNRIDEGFFTYQGSYIPYAYKQYIKTLERIGKFSDGESSLDLLVITLQKETSLERARTMQRNFVAWYLNGSRGGDMKDAALVAYVSPDQADWRFSLVKMDYKFEKSKTGKMKVKEEFTPARRWSFLVGENEKSHTAQSRLVNILADDEEAITLPELEKAFDIETVTKEFFLKYRELFLRTKEALDKVVKKDPKIKSDFEAKGVDTVNFAKKLLGQIVFLYFLQKKGWFGVGRDDDWGAGSKHFLRSLFAKQHGDYRNFFNDILEPLFYEALRIDRSHDDDYYSRFNCKIPFLNGGLFDPIGNYDWVHTDIHLPDQLFSNTHKTKEGDEGDGILDVFDRYNFTVREDEPLEKEVAIDPELLGKAYEKFNAIRPDNFDKFTKALKSGKKGDENKFNKKFGVYYTPREIVHYMCKQSLINYLFTRAEEAELSGAIKKQDIEDLIEVGEMITEHEATALIKQEKIKNGIQKSTEYTALLSDSIRENAAAIDNWLAEITVCDPAVGSGAFPVGMMNEIVRARNVLSVFLNNQERSDYEFKRRCIEHSLYGVDIDPGAVEIAKLRLWLSLVVDEEDIKNIKPLPNLDYMIVCGNSLLGVEKNLFNLQHFTDLEKLKPMHFNETNPAKKQEYKKQIDDLISQITKGHKEFDFEVYFSEVFHAKGGFDVVIMNPPYGAEFSKADKEFLKKKYIHIVERIRNSFLYFMGLGYDIVRKDGIVSTIEPNEFLFQIYMTKARRYFVKNSQILYAINTGGDVFEAIVPTCVVALKKSKLSSYKIPVADLRMCTLKELSRSLKKTNTFAVSSSDIVLGTPNSIFAFDLHSASLINKLSESCVPFENFCDDVANGISTSCDEIYIVSNSLVAQNGFERKYVKPCIRGGQFNRYYCPIETGDCVLYVTNEFNPKTGRRVIEYLSGHKPLLIKKCVEKKQGKRDWHVLFRGRYEELFRTPKILVRQTGDRIVAAIDYDVGYYCIDSVNVALIKKSAVSELKYLLGLLNSVVVNYYYREISQEGGRVLAQVKPQRIRSLPIPIASPEQQKEVEQLVDRILVVKAQDAGADVSVWERKIDQLAYELYGLTEEEIRIVEGETK